MKHILLILLLISTSIYSQEDIELKELKEKLSSSDTQTDMNINSYKMSQYLEKKLINLEKTIIKQLDDKAQKLFNQLSKDWGTYRDSQVKFKGDIYRGGSIQPLIHNSTFIELTEQRILELKTILDY